MQSELDPQMLEEIKVVGVGADAHCLKVERDFPGLHPVIYEFLFCLSITREFFAQTFRDNPSKGHTKSPQAKRFERGFREVELKFIEMKNMIIASDLKANVSPELWELIERDYLSIPT